jgi:hypothetical protein
MGSCFSSNEQERESREKAEQERESRKKAEQEHESRKQAAYRQGYQRGVIVGF